MKIIDRIKKGLIGIGTFLLTIPTKVFALYDSEIAELYGVAQPIAQPEYGIPKTGPIIIIWKLARIFIIPIALFIGLIIYLKKSKSSYKTKIITVLVTICIVAILYVLINFIVNIFG